MMIVFLRSSFRLVTLGFLILLLGACSVNTSSGLEGFQSPNGRYAFLYPTGWIRVAVEGGPEIVYHDLINGDETLSLVVSELNNDIDLNSLGSPKEVAKRMLGGIMLEDNSDRGVDLLNAIQREANNHIFYDLEYIIHSPTSERHEIATVVVDRGYLYTFAAGTKESRWANVKSLFKNVIESFTFLI